MTNFRRALLALFTFVGITAGSLVVVPGIASAHNKSVVASCSTTNGSSVAISLTSYADDNNASHKNTVAVKIDGATQTLNEDGTDFGTTYTQTFGGLDPTVDHTYQVDVTAYDDSQYNLHTGVVTITHCKTPKPADGYTDRTVDGTCTVGQNTVDVKVYRTPFTWTYNAQTNTWTKVVGVEFLLSTTPRTLTAQEQINCKPASGYTDRTDNGVCSVGANTVTVTVYRTPFSYSYINGVWTKVNGAEFVLSTSQRLLTDAEKITCKPSYDPLVVVVETPCTAGATDVTVTTTTTTYHAEYINGVWVKVADTPTVVVTHRSLTQGEKVTCVPTHQPKVVTTDDGTPKCGDTSVATTTTTTTYTYTYEYVNDVPTWVEHTTVVVTHGSRAVQTDPCPTTTTTPPTTVPPTTTIPTCFYNGNLPADSPLCVAPTTTTVAPATTVSIPPNVVLPRTGGGTSGLTIGGILVGAGILALAATRRRKVRNV